MNASVLCAPRCELPETSRDALLMCKSVCGPDALHLTRFDCTSTRK